MDKKKEYYQQKREHILMMHKKWRDKQPNNCNNELVYCVVCKMMFPVRRLEKHKTSGMHLKELDDYKRLHQCAIDGVSMRN